MYISTYNICKRGLNVVLYNGGTLLPPDVVGYQIKNLKLKVDVLFSNSLSVRSHNSPNIINFAFGYPLELDG